MKKTILVTAALAASCAWAYTFTTELETLADTTNVDSTAYINVLGTGTAKPGNQWGWSKDVVFDGYVHTGASAWFEPSSSGGDNSGAWAGYKLNTASMVRKIRYYARNDGSEDAARAVGCVFQGANSEDFTDAVTLYTIPVTDLDTLTNGCQEVVIDDTALLAQSFTYLRVMGDYGGNLCEAEFVGGTGSISTESAPAAPSLSTFAAINGKVTYAFSVASDAYTYRLERRYAGEEDWETLATHEFVDEGSTVSGSVEVYLAGPADYRLVAVNYAGETAGDAQSVGFRKAVTGTVIGYDAVSGCEVANAFDGNLASYYESYGTGEKGQGAYVGYNLGENRSIVGVRLVPRSGQEWRTKYAVVQVASSADFSDATQLFKLEWTSLPSTSVTEVRVGDAAVDGTYTEFTAGSGAYVRYYQENSDGEDLFCNVAEVEFLTNDYAPDATPVDFSVSTDYASAPAFTWDVPSTACMTTRIYRATAPGGPYATLMDVRSDCTNVVDSTTSVGVLYYYRAAFVNTVGGTEYASDLTEYVTFRRVEQIERESLTSSALKSGMSVIGYNWNVDSNGAKAFDGDTSTYADLNAADDDKVNIKIGVDLGSAYVVDSFRIYPRSDSYLYRMNGVTLGASNDSSDSYSWTNATAISESCAITEAAWYTFETTDKTAYRFVYVMKPGESDFYGNVAELVLFGYSESQAQSVLLAPEDTAAEWKGSKAVITWTASPNAKSYRVERSSDGGATWTVAESEITDATYADSPERPTKVGYIYRVASVDGNGLAYTVSVTPTGTPAAPGLSIFLR